MFALAWALSVALYRLWTCDDAFITFRYALNFVQGDGLVFNVGERVEGYTNFLWTLWIALGLKLGISAENTAHVTGIAAYLACIGLLIRAHPALTEAGRARGLLPVAALAAALHDDWAIYATSGLETSLFTLLVLSAVLVLLGGLSEYRRSALAALLFALATLTRPDGVVFATVGGFYVLIASQRRFRAALIFAACFAALWVPHQAWRMSYYGDFFPNTYYAKSAYLTWYSQGLRYLGLFVAKYWVLVVVPVVVFTWLWRRGPAATTSESQGARPALAHPHAAWLSVSLVLAYTFYVVRVGGGFMFARLLIPATPFLLILLDVALTRLAAVAPRGYRWALIASLVGLAATPYPVRYQNITYGVANEWAFYRGTSDKADQKADELRHYLGGLNVRVAYLGGEARIMYRAQIPTAIECETGLTDRFIAHTELSKRGRPGHEKHAPLTYVIDQRKAHFAFHKFATNVLPLDDYIPKVHVSLGTVTGRVLHWDPALMAELTRRGAVVLEPTQLLDQAIIAARDQPPDAVRLACLKWQRFYFDHQPDPARRAALCSPPPSESR